MSWNTALPFPPRRAVALSALVAVATGPLHAQTTAGAAAATPDATATAAASAAAANAAAANAATPMPVLTAAGAEPPSTVSLAAPPAASVPAGARTDEQEPTTLRAEEFSGRPDRVMNMYRNVEITRGATGVTADTACYLRVEDEITAEGNINMWRFGDRYKGDALELNMETGKGWVKNPSYKLHMNNAQGTAQRIEFLGEDQAVVIDGTYSTCEGPNPDWYLKSSTLRLDQGRDIGTATKTIIYFKDVRCRSRCPARAARAGCRRPSAPAPRARPR
jgi:LPS-assembly protein